MSNYFPKQSFTVNKFTIDVYPYVAAPENVHEEGIALQYGADFRVSFTKGGPVKNNIGLIQLILPRTVGTNKKIGQWNIDRTSPANETITIAKAMYGDDGVLIGPHSDYYKDQPKRNISGNTCSLIDTPREIQAAFNPAGIFTGNTTTMFANYIIEMDSQHGTLYNTGMVWGYAAVQDAHDPSKFSMTVTAPAEVLLTASDEHPKVIAGFLGMDIKVLKSCIH